VLTSFSDPHRHQPEADIIGLEQTGGGIIMARFRARTLRWKAVESNGVVGYKIYWAKGGEVTYASESVYVKDLTAIEIPDALEGFVAEPGVFMFGITTIDQWGNESDMTTMREPFHFSVPPAPESLWVAPLSVPNALDPMWLDNINSMVAEESNHRQTEEELLISQLDDIFDDDETEPEPKNQEHKPSEFYEP
jgi:hypothetical protein